MATNRKNIAIITKYVVACGLSAAYLNLTLTHSKWSTLPLERYVASYFDLLVTNRPRTLTHRSCRHIREFGAYAPSRSYRGILLHLRSSVCYRTISLQPKYQTTGVNSAYTITFCCNRPIHSQHCLPARVEA